MQLLEGRFVPFCTWALGGSLPSWLRVRCGAFRYKAFSCQISLLPEGEHVWSWFQAAETTSQAAVPTEPEAAQTLLGPMGSLGLGENSASAAILSQAALGLSFVPRAQFPFAECSSEEHVLCRNRARP